MGTKMFKLISKLFGWIFKIVFFPFRLIWWIVTASARKKSKQRNLEKWSCESSRKQREQEERREREHREADEYFEKYYR